MRWPIIALSLLGACSNEANHLGNPLLLPFSGISTAFENARYDDRRGQVEIIVKSQFDAIKSDIRAGGGPVLTKAMETARIPVADRPARIIQLQSDFALYDAAPGALVTALMVYGN